MSRTIPDLINIHLMCNYYLRIIRVVCVKNALRENVDTFIIGRTRADEMIDMNMAH